MSHKNYVTILLRQVRHN
uniref:Uncharacterized protein n=1 Tax=Anguilla anguilla TaxID=7936 RepID=A0A0E9VYG8_ANGAN